ncbi:MAG: SDR family NAD(P)-dependent oxidoreductase [Acidimicrobiales bacterium]
MDFRGGVALVTGGAGGIGGDLCRALAREGANVAVTDLDGAGAEAVGKELGTFGAAMDVSSESSVQAIIDRVTGELGPIHMLFNVAGIHARHESMLAMPLETYDKIMAVNLRGMLITTQKVGNQMVAKGLHGVIVNTGSSAGFHPGGTSLHYCLSKVGVHALTKAAAKEFAPHGIRVNAVAPGPVYTPMSRRTMDDPAGRAAWEARIPLHRIADTGDIVDVMLFLASDNAKNMTGAIVSTDGGGSA